MLLETVNDVDALVAKAGCPSCAVLGLTGCVLMCP